MRGVFLTDATGDTVILSQYVLPLSESNFWPILMGKVSDPPRPERPAAPSLILVLPVRG
jgi:hypothetical protein